MIFNVPEEKYKEANLLKKRDCFQPLKEYLDNGSTNVCAIYGLRRTGKSTMMFQAMEYAGIENIGYILCEKGDSYEQLCSKLSEYISERKKVVFIDEITKIQSFITSAAGLADYYSGTGTKIVVTGTDSLGICLATRGELYDRADIIHTTYVSYGEFTRLIEKTDTDDFIHYAGVLSHEENVKEREFFDRKTASHYVDTAISSNITNTFFDRNLPKEFVHRYDKLMGLHNRNMLIPTITSIVEMYSGVITKDTLNAYFGSNEYANIDISSAFDMLEKHGIFLNRDNIGENIEAEIAFHINSRRNVNDQIGDETVDQVIEYLSDLELLVEIPVVRCNMNSTQKKYMYERERYIYQAGMKYCQAKAIIDILRGESGVSFSPAEKDMLCSKIEEDVKGQILEVTAFNDVQNFLDHDRYEIFKMQFTGEKDGEIDMVVYDKKEKTYHCFEIKHSLIIDEKQQKNLIHRPYQNILDENYGTRKSLNVLYRGATKAFPGSGVNYINIGDFLISVYAAKEKNIDSIISACLNKKDPIIEQARNQMKEKDIEKKVKDINSRLKQLKEEISRHISDEKGSVVNSFEYIANYFRHIGR